VLEVTRNVRTPLRVMVVALVCLTWTNPAKTLLIEKPWEYSRYKKWAGMARWLNNHTEPGTSVVVYAAGIIPWVAPNRTYVDMLGMNDAAVARMPAHRAPKGVNPLTYFAPGHNKYSIAWTVERYHPDVILHVWGMDEQAEELKEVRPNYHAVSTTNDTRNVVLVRDDTKNVRP